MTSANINGWYYIKLTLKSLDDGTSTKVFNLSNRPLIDESDGATVYWPILKSISNIGTDTGDYLPASIGGEIILDDSPDSFSYERKFSDFLQRYTPIGGTVQIYSANTALDDQSITGDFTLDWTTTITGYRRTGNEIRLTVSERGLPVKTMTKIIDATTFPSAPGKSIGKYLPIVFGPNVSVIGQRITADGSDPTFVYATTLADDFYNGGIQNQFAKDSTGAYIQVLSASAVGTAVYTAGASGGTPFATSLTAGVQATPLKLATETSYYYLITQIDILFKGRGAAGTVDGTLKLDVYDAVSVAWNGSSVYKPNVKIASAQVAAVDYDASFDAAPDFYITFTLNKAIPLDGGKQYFVALSYDRTSGDTIQFKDNINPTDGGARWTINTNADTWYYTSSAVYRWESMKVYGVKFTDTPQSTAAYIDSNGLGASYVALTQKTAVTGYTNPDLSVIDYLFQTNGLNDDAGGSITGVGNTNLTTPANIIRCLDLQWNGTTWATTGENLDYTKFSDTFTTAPLDRAVQGYGENKRTTTDLMSEVCRNTAFRIVRYNGASKKYAAYGWGKTRATAKVISDEDSKLISVTQLGAETIINNVTLNYGRTPINFDPLKNFNNSNIYNYTSRSAGSALSSLLFGNAELKDNNFNFLSSVSSTYAASMVTFLSSVYAFPHIYVVLEVPLFKYKSLETMDVIEICHPSLPAYYGTSSNAKLPYYGSGTDDLLEGYYWKRFQRFRAQIEGKVLNYNLGEFPTMRLNCRLLLNPSDPT